MRSAPIIHAAVLRGFSAVSPFPASLLRDSHFGNRSRRSLSSFGNSIGDSSAKHGRSSAAWPTRTASARRSSSRNKGSITVSTSVATDIRKLLSSRASGTTAAAISVASQSSRMTGENALAVCLIRFFMASISPFNAITFSPVFFLRKAGFDFGDLSRQCRDIGCKCVAFSPRAIEIAAEIVH